MRVRHKGERIEIEVEGKDIKDVFVQMAAAVEVFGNTTCGNCDSQRTVPVVRENAGNMFHEMRCIDCGATLGFGQRREGGALFPKKRDKDGNWLSGNGWVKWRKPDAEFA